MEITIQKIKDVLFKKGYKWIEEKPQIIGIRTNIQVPDVFNDIICVVYKDKLFVTTCTTEPGTTYQKKPLNPKGCWVMMPNQMIDAYSLGYHQGKEDHRALRSTGKIFGLRENDKDGIILNDKDAVSSWADGTTIGANIHGANKMGVTKTVGRWSAGCQVLDHWSKKEEMIDIFVNFEKTNKSLWKKNTEWVFGKSGVSYTYTLLTEKDFQ